MTHDDETLMAYADGALDGAEARAVAEAEARDPEVAARIAAFRESRAAIAAAFGPAEPVPAALGDRVAALIAAAEAEEAAKVVAFDPARRRSGRLVPVWQGAIAAGLALVMGLTAGLSLREGATEGPAGLGIALLDDGGLGPVLAALPSGEAQEIAGGRVTAIGTFLTEEGTLCREFEYDARSGTSVVAVACREAEGWQTRLAVAAGLGGDGYAPASSLETLDAWMGSTGAGAPMSPEDEAAALAALQ